MKDVVSWLAIAAAGLSAIFGSYAAFFVKVRDDQDKFIADLQAQSRWASLAAAAAGVSVLLQAVEKWLK